MNKSFQYIILKHCGRRQKWSGVFFLCEILLLEDRRLSVSYKACGEPCTKTSPLVDFLQIRAEVVQWIEQAQPQLRALLKTAAEHLAGKEGVGRLPALITRTSLEAQLQHALGTCRVREKVTACKNHHPLGALCDCSLSLSLFVCRSFVADRCKYHSCMQKVGQSERKLREQ
jgi:hypothetical protein